jgi:hypothetical protein
MLSAPDERSHADNAAVLRGPRKAPRRGQDSGPSWFWYGGCGG